MAQKKARLQRVKLLAESLEMNTFPRKKAPVAEAQTEA